ncbi:MAG: hypothetical protein R2747_05245 [Pyrinomonadaceae bacterium]
MNRIILVLAFAVFSNLVFSQPKKETPVKQCDADQARQIVDQLALESKSVEESDKKINILTKVADFLWDLDQPTARAYFSEAFKIAMERFEEKGLVNKSDTNFLVETEEDYRFSIIRTVASKDAELAKKMTEAVLKAYDENKNLDSRQSYQKDQEIAQTLRFAMRISSSNPDLAMALFRRVKGYPISSSWVGVFRTLGQENPALGNQIYSELLEIHPNDEISNLLNLSGYPFGKHGIFGSPYYADFGQVDPLPVNPALQRMFLNVFLNRVINLKPGESGDGQRIPPAGYALSALREFEPFIRRDFPDLMAKFSAALANANALVTDEGRKNMDQLDKFKERAGMSFEQKIAELELMEEKGTLTDFMIVTLINQARKQEELEMLEPWLDKIKEPKVKEQSLNFFFFNSSQVAINEKRFADARKLAEKVPQIEHRAVLYFDMAEMKLMEPLTRVESLEILTEVYKMAEKAPDSVEKAQVLLGLAYMFKKIDRFNAFEALSKTVQATNKLDNPNLFTNFISYRIVGKNFGVFAGYSVPGFNISQTLDEMSKEDFQGALSYSRGFSDRYVRTLAVLATVKGCEKIGLEKKAEK